MLRAFQRPPDRQQDGTATWSLTTRHRALRRAADGRPAVSTWTSLQTRWHAGSTCQQRRPWCHTGTAPRKRQDGTVGQTTAVACAPRHATPTKR
jgi:hypothetical protein